MGITVEQNVALRNALRNNLRYIVPSVRVRYTSDNREGKKAIAFSKAPSPDPTVPKPTLRAGPFAYSEIDFATAVVKAIVIGKPSQVIRIFQVTMTVGGETNITYYDGTDTITGPMDFGGTSEPRGIVDSPGVRILELKQGNSFSIGSSIAVQVSGYVLYRYIEYL